MKSGYVKFEVPDGGIAFILPEDVSSIVITNDVRIFNGKQIQFLVGGEWVIMAFDLENEKSKELYKIALEKINKYIIDNSSKRITENIVAALK